MLRRKRHCGKTLCESADAADFRKIVTGSEPVSYTHLTLPTKLEV